MYSRYNPVSGERFYPVETENPPVPPVKETADVPVPQTLPAGETSGGSAVVQTGGSQPVQHRGFMNGILDSFKQSDGKLDYGSIIILLITVMLFLEDSESETDLIIIAAALLIFGF